MKCDKIFFLALTVAFVGFAAQQSWANGMAAAPTAIVPPPPVVGPVNGGAPIVDAAPTEVLPTDASAPVPTAPAAPAAAGVKIAAPGALPAAEEKPGDIPKSVTEIVDDLRKSEKDVSLEDVARAQDALTRLDLLLDIQKRINDIQKERNNGEEDKQKASRASMAGMGMPPGAFNFPMPAAALGNNDVGMPSGMAPTATPTHPMNIASAMEPSSSSDMTVDQITGVNGRYRAVIDVSGSKKTVEQGDKVGRYSVQKISATGVTLANGNDRKVLAVENGGAAVVIRSR